ncbi:hypothetical protein JW898_02985 [Candidatus Woesearchaeota archaeon]|nr:hypothetical protein [Candidatus Woesearchaeota archaeon]
MDEEEYAIVSKKEFLALKRELDRFKKNPLEGSESGENLQASIDNLNKSLNVMLEVFKQAAEDMKLEEHDTEMVAKQIGPINDKIETLIDQNQKIAKGIVAIADMVKEKLEEISEKAASRPSLPPLSGGPAPRPGPMSARPSAPPSFGPAPPPRPAPPGPGGPPGFGGGLPPLGAPDGMEDEELPPLGPPGAPPGPGRRDIMGGLMK